MIIIPAIDLKDGKCVRLSQGRMDQETIYSENPIEMAKHWESKGAERLHIVDLNGAVTGKPFHSSLIKEMIHSVSIPVEVGGGIRNLETIEDYLSSGASWVILGTAALKNRSLLKESCQLFPKKVILGIDAKEGKVAVEGWKEEASIEAIDLVKEFEGVGLSAIIFTDIERDGMSTGLNLESTRSLSRSTSIPVIASGGVSRIEDIVKLMEMESDGIIGVITGRALYNGSLDLEEAIRLAKKDGKIGR
ncbi:MAG: 1-(5-phosphoribosyl)-5-[(5-phosphoribosylamino)methylideneamino]imidazole-4-carboxamide isomerase [Deltaproteobacteria bacterium]|nr:1-(5-phosphoribosyl)-5-[(5-phosphoribosylamino)methylideneamino]imidazole-4-carboxamide isomerase [Deltaproteobacteria bacterium]